jgi:small subunit ribosomal protein S16
MAVKIRLRRMGAKHQPSYRIVVAPALSPRDGRYLDQVGFYNPVPDPPIIRIDREKTIEWLRKGAQPTDTVAKLLAKFDIDPVAVRKGIQPSSSGAAVAGASLSPTGSETVDESSTSPAKKTVLSEEERSSVEES